MTKPLKYKGKLLKVKEKHSLEDVKEACAQYVRLHTYMMNLQNIIKAGAHDLPEAAEFGGYGFGYDPETGDNEIFFDPEGAKDRYEKAIYIYNQATVIENAPLPEAVAEALSRMYGEMPKQTRDFIVAELYAGNYAQVIARINKRPDARVLWKVLDDIGNEDDYSDLSEVIGPDGPRATKFGTPSIDIRAQPPVFGKNEAVPL